MQVEMKPFREASSLPSGLAWNAKDEVWFCGDDFGNVMIYSEVKDSFEGFNACDSSINAVAINNTGNICALGFNDALNLREYPKVNSVVKDSLLRKELPPTCIQYDSTGSLIFVSSMQEDVHVYSVEGSTSSQTKINTNGKAIRNFALSPSNAFIGLVDVEGTVKIFSLKIANKTLQSVDLNSEKFDVVSKKVSQFGGLGIDFGCKLSWYPDESRRVLLAAPSLDGSIVFISKDGDNSWSESFLTCDAVGQPTLCFGKGLPLSAVSFSPSGRHLAACDTDGSVLVWSTNTASPADSVPLRKITAGVPLVDLVWNQKKGSDYLLLLSKDSYARVNDVVPKTTSAQESISVAVSEVSGSPSSMPPSALARKRLTKPGKVEFRLDNNSSSEPTSASTTAEDDDDNLFDEDEKTSSSAATASAESSSSGADAISIRQIKQAAFRSRVVDDESDKPTVDEETTEYDDDDDAIVMDESGSGGLQTSGAEGLSADELLRLASLSGVTAMPLQEAFQPACTKPDEKQRRYLVWNSFGNITTREEAVENRVEIRFSNTLGNNKNEAFADRDGFSMASLSLEGAIFATEKETDDETTGRRSSEFKKALPGSTIFYHAFPGQKQLEGVNESFRHTLPDGEGVLAVAVGRGWCAVATDMRLLRVFSSTGIQVKIMPLPGPAVTLCGFESSLAVVYHGAAPLDEHYQMRLDMFEVNWRDGCSMRTMVSGMSVPLSRKSRLSWVGFEVDLSLLTLCDSAGVFHTLSRAFTSQWEWLPVLNVEQCKKSIDHVYWPVMVKNCKLAYVLLNGESKPAVYPQPVTHSRLFSMPVVAPSYMKEGSAECIALKEKLSQLMWEDMKTRHCEAMKDDIGKNGLFAVGFDNQEAIDRMLSKQELETDKLVLKLLQEACKVNQIPQALNLALKLRTEVAIVGAIKVANNLGRVTVASALDAMLRHKQMLNSIIMEQQQLQQMQQQQSQAYDEVEVVSNPVADVTVAEEKKNQLSARLPPTGRSLKPPAAAVSPEAAAPAAAPVKDRGTLNPFAVSGSTPQKRKSAFEGVVDLQKESPSPKKTLLNRQSSFSNVARAQQKGDKTFL